MAKKKTKKKGQAKHRQPKGDGRRRRRGVPPEDRPLTAMQARFVDFEVNGKFSSAESARRAGYSERTAAKQASQLLDNPRIEKAIAEGRARAAKEAEIEGADVVREWGRLGFSNILDVASVKDGHLDVHDSSTWPEDAARAVMEITETTTEHGGSLKVKLHPKPGALDSLGKYLGLLIDRKKHEHSGPNGGPIPTQEPLDLSKLSEEDLRELRRITALASSEDD